MVPDLATLQKGNFLLKQVGFNGAYINSGALYEQVKASAAASDTVCLSSDADDDGDDDDDDGDAEINRAMGKIEIFWTTLAARRRSGADFTPTLESGLDLAGRFRVLLKGENVFG